MDLNHHHHLTLFFIKIYLFL